jgi:hypothetical protein
MTPDCRMCELFSLIDGWLSEANSLGNSLDESTRDTLRECGFELADQLPPRGHAFHERTVR